jgi:hypothetical protein
MRIKDLELEELDRGCDRRDCYTIVNVTIWVCQESSTKVPNDGEMLYELSIILGK